MNNFPMYIKNDINDTLDGIININKGKKIKVYITIKDSNEFKDKNFEGILENGCNNYIILSNPNTGEWYLIPNKYINFIYFYENINY